MCCPSPAGKEVQKKRRIGLRGVIGFAQEGGNLEVRLNRKMRNIITLYLNSILFIA
jgi:hypothetical protein